MQVFTIFGAPTIIILKIFLSVLFLIISLIGCKKSNKEINIAEHGSDSLDFFFQEANNDSIAFEKRIEYNRKAIEIISLDNNDSINRVNYFKVANRYFNMNAIEEYKNVSFLLMEKSIRAKDTTSLLKAYTYITDYYMSKNIPDSIYLFNRKVQKIYNSRRDYLNTAKTLLNKAILQHNQGDFLGSEKTVFEVLQKLRFSNDIVMLHESYNFLGVIYGELAEYKLAEFYYQKALEVISRKATPPEYHLKAATLNNLGNLYRYQNKNNKSISFFKSALREKNLFQDRPHVYAMVLDNLAYSQLKENDHRQLPALFFRALKIRDSLNIVSGIVINKIHLSEYYAIKKDTMNAKKYISGAYELANKSHDSKDVLQTLKQLSNVDPKNALKYSTEYYKINDSLQLSERKIRNKFARIEFETEELIIEKDQLVEQRKTLIYSGLGIILLGVFIFIIRFQAAKNRELRLVQEQQRANEEVYQLMLNQQNKIEEVRQLEKKRIAQELHDGILGKLFGTRLNLGILNSGNNEQAVTSRTKFIDELKTIEQEIREISHDLNSEKTAIFNNFVLMVSNFIETQRTVCKAAIDFEMDPRIDWNHIDNIAKINLYRILQEAFQNINKYADATQVFVKFANSNTDIELVIEDDGAGFNFLKKKKGIGLQNMQARIGDSGGTMSVKSEPGKGTCLQFSLPYKETPNTSINEKSYPITNGR